jgi:hypothetical protein
MPRKRWKVRKGSRPSRPRSNPWGWGRLLCSILQIGFKTRQGCQIFLGTSYQNGKNFTNIPQKIPNVYQIYQMAVKWTKRPWNIPKSSIARHSKNYPNFDFWFENIPSGNPARHLHVENIHRVDFLIAASDFETDLKTGLWFQSNFTT